MRTPTSGLLTAAALAFSLAAIPAHAEPVVVDRVIAVVGEAPLLLSDLRARLVPLLASLDQQKLSAEDRQKAERKIAGDQIQRMIDVELVAQAAARVHVDAMQAEIDEAISRVAAQGKMSVPDLYAAAAKMGMNNAAYRKEIGAQLREAKMLRLRPLPKGIKLSDLDEKKQVQVLDHMRREWLLEMRLSTYVELRFTP